MTKKFFKSGISLLICLALLFSVASISVFAKTSEDNGIIFHDPIFDGNQEITVIYGSYYTGHLTYKYDGYSYDAGFRSGGSGTFPLITHTPIVAGEPIEITIELFDNNGNSCVVTKTFIIPGNETSAPEDDGIIFFNPIFDGNKEITVIYGPYYTGHLTFKYDGYSYDAGTRSGGSGTFPLITHTPIVAGEPIEITIELFDKNGNSRVVTKTFIIQQEWIG